jgi:hypothetical protein
LLYHQQTLSTGLLNSLKKQEVRVINGWRDVNSFVLCYMKFFIFGDITWKKFLCNKQTSKARRTMCKSLIQSFSNNKEVKQLLKCQMIEDIVCEHPLFFFHRGTAINAVFLFTTTSVWNHSTAFIFR